jgi:ABC-2 type transport system permease protein
VKKIARVARQEYRRNVLKKSFLLTLLSVPFMIVFSLGLGLFLESLEEDSQPVGYVDLAGVFSRPPAVPVRGRGEAVEFRPFPHREAAEQAVTEKEIEAFFFLDADYGLTRKAELVYTERPGSQTIGQFFDFLQINLVPDGAASHANRIAVGTYVTVRSVNGQRSVPAGGPSFGLMMPLFINLAFLALLLISSGYLMGAVAEEKENRTMEMLISSVSPLKLIAGKIAGITAIGMTLLLTWSGMIVLGILIASQLGVAWFQELSFDWSIVLATAVIAVPAYVLVTALMTGIGAMATSTQEGQSISSIFIILHLIPVYVAAAFLNDPNGTLATTLSFLPFTGLMTIGMRNLFAAVPFWQVAVSATVQSVCALGAIWLAGKALRQGMLSYRRRLSWRGLFRVAQSAVAGATHE